MASPQDQPEQPDWLPVTEPRLVFRFLKEPDPDADGFAENFSSDADRGKGAVEGEHPELLTGMSVFASEAAARQRYAVLKDQALKKRSNRNRRRQRPFKMSIGDHIGEVLLRAGEGFEIVDDGDPEGHLTLRGDKHRLAACVARIYPAARSPT